MNLKNDRNEIAPGDMLGPYRLESLIGTGGTGEVWKAHDSRLGRTVAIKFANEAFHDRFLHEARAVAALNHPHICTLHDIGPNYLVMEYIEGKPPHGRLPLRRALEYARQILDALDAAHQQGIIHRDVKPANILVTERGIKLLDFGLARRDASRTAPAGVPDIGITQAGVAIGTPQYMTPEQIQGDPLDARTDIFLFGCVLYQMLTGRSAFDGKNPAGVASAILERTAPSLRDVAPPALDTIVRKCLENDPNQRWQTAADLKAALAIGEEHAEFAAATPRSKWIWTAVAAALLASGGVLWREHAWVKAPWRPNTSVTITALTGQPEAELQPAISPDGKSVAYVREGGSGGYHIWVKSLDGEARRLTSEERPQLHPSWSPDGQRIAYLQASPAAAVVMVMPAGGGEPKEVVKAGRFDPGHMRGSAGPLARQPNPGPAWSPDGKEIAYRQCPQGPPAGCPLFAITLETAQIRRLTEQVPNVSDFSPAWSPDGKYIAFARFTNFVNADLYVIPSAGGEPRRVTKESHNIKGITWTPDSASLVFGSDRSGAFSLWRVSLRDSTITHVYSTGDNALEPSVSKAGNLMVYTDAAVSSSVWCFDVEQKTRRKLIASPRQNQNAAWSPDGRRIAFASNRLGSWQVWTVNPDGGQPAQLTSLRDTVLGLIRWAPDGRQLAIEAQMQGHFEVLIVPAQGGTPKTLRANIAEPRLANWSHDGKSIYFVSAGGGNQRLWKVPVTGGTAERVADANVSDLVESADGRSLYISGNQVGGLQEIDLQTGHLRSVPVLEDIRPDRWWTLGPAGFYFYDTPEGEAGFFVYSPTTRKITQLADVGRGLPLSTPSFSVSPDGRYLLYTRVDESSSSLMAVRGSFLSR